MSAGVISKIMLKYKSYNLNSKIILTNEVLNSYILQFWNEVFTSIVENGEIKHLMVLCKIKYFDSKDNGYKTLGPLRRVEFSDQELFSEYLQERLGIIIDSYSPLGASEIIFTYIIKDGGVSTKDRQLLLDLSDKEITFHDFNKIKLPVSMNPADYGTIRGKSLIDGTTRYFVRNSNRVYEIDISLDQLTNKVTIIGASGLEWTDTKISSDQFKREIGKCTFYFLDGEMFLVKRQLPAKPFTRFRNKL